MKQPVAGQTTHQASAAPVWRAPHKRSVCEQVYDVDGALWDVQEARSTNHGFDLLFGFAANSHLPNCYLSGKPRLITTPALAAYFAVHRTDPHANFDLPVSPPTVRRVRRDLGFHFFRDRRAAWQQRADELKTLTSHEFAHKYDVDFKQVHEWRFLILGRIARPLNWWNNPETLAILRGPATTREISEQLGITADHAARLRKQTRLPGMVSPKRVRRLPERWRSPEMLALLRSDLTNRELAAKLLVSVACSEVLRRALAHDPELGQEQPLRRRNSTGEFARPKDWWRDPAVLAVLRSNLTLLQMGEKLCISQTHASRLRQADRSQAEALRPAA
jgi:hypothetical protein